MKINVNALAPFLGIRGKLLVAFVGISIVPFAILLLYGDRATNQALESANASNLRRQLSSSIGHLEAYFGDLDADARTLSYWVQTSGVVDDGQLDAHERTKVEKFFAQFVAGRPDYYQVRLLDRSGREIARVNRVGNRIVAIAARDLQGKSHRYYFREAQKSTSRTYFSQIDLNMEHSVVEQPHRLVFRVGRHVKDPDGKGVGLVVLNLNASVLLKRIAVLRPEKGDVLFVDHHGRFTRQDCSGGQCSFDFGDVGGLRFFDAATVKSLLAGDRRVMLSRGGSFLSYAPIPSATVAGRSRWHLAIVYSREQLLAPVARMRRRAYYFAAVVAVVALVLALFATRAMADPLKRILHFVEGIEEGDFARPLVVDTRDEIEALATAVAKTARTLDRAQQRLISFNEELKAEVERKLDEISTLHDGRRAMARQLEHADRLTSLGMLSASLAHELGNPLAGIKTVIQVRLRSSAVNAATRRSLELVLSEVNRLVETLARVTGFVRPVRAQKVATTLAEVFERVALLVDRESRAANIELRLGGDARNRPLIAEERRLEQVLLNLVMNALQAMTEPGRIDVRGELRDGRFEISVTDSGPGIPEEARESVFEPFFTTKSGGTGLGLSIVRSIISEMNGDIWLELPDAGGTRIVIQLPIDDTTPPQEAT